MQSLNFHFLNARNQLCDLKQWLCERLTYAYEQASTRLELQPIDVLVRASNSPHFVIPEKGHGAAAWEPGGVISVTVDPENSALRCNENFSLERMLVHELHHIARWDGPGYGKTLGESLVSEGLAGHFVQEIFGGPFEPWENVELPGMHSYAMRAMSVWDDQNYDHNVWFFGAGDIPRWTGYTLGFQLVERYLTDNPSESPSTLVHMVAGQFRASLKNL